MSICNQCKHFALSEDFEPEENARECDIDENDLIWKVLPPWAAAFLEKEMENPYDFYRRSEIMDVQCRDMKECPCFESL